MTTKLLFARQKDYYEANLQNNRAPNTTLSGESVPSMILGASKEKLSVKAEEDPHPRRHQERRVQISRVKKKGDEQLALPRRHKFIYFLCLLLINYYVLTFSTISNPAL